MYQSGVYDTEHCNICWQNGRDVAFPLAYFLAQHIKVCHLRIAIDAIPDKCPAEGCDVRAKSRWDYVLYEHYAAEHAELHIEEEEESDEEEESTSDSSTQLDPSYKPRN